MMVNIKTKHEDLTNFLSYKICGAKSNWKTPLNISCDWFSYQGDSRTQLFMIPISILIPLGLIPIPIPIPGFPKFYDSDSNSDPNSSNNWFRFWFRFQCFPKKLISILIPFQHHVILTPTTILKNWVSIPSLILESVYDSGLIYNSDA